MNFINNLIEIIERYRMISAEMSLLVTIILGFFSFAIFKTENKARLTSFISIFGLLFALYFLPENFGDETSILLFNKSYLINKHNSIIKFITICGVILVHVAIILMSGDSRRNGINKFSNFELPILINFSLLGILLAISSNDLMVLYLSLELQALPAYILTAIRRDSDYSVESGVKYFVLGVMSSAIFLYGVSLVYFSLGTINYEEIVNILTSNDLEISSLCLIGIIFIIFGLMFKLGSAPLHTWIADVYQGAHNAVLTFFTVVPKLAITYVLYVLYHFVFVGKYFNINTNIITFFAFCSFLVGTVGAIKQTNFKRLLAYSAISNSGFFLLSIIGDLTYSFAGLAIYAVSYMLATYGLLSFISYYWNEVNDQKNYFISDLSGIAKKKPFLAMSVFGLLFSIAGIPPFIGFFGKMYILLSSISSMHLMISFVSLIATVVGLIYYLGIIKVMYFEDKQSDFSFTEGSSCYGNLTIIYAIFSIISIFFLEYFLKFLI